MEAHGPGKQGAAFGYIKGCGCRAQLATCARIGRVLNSEHWWIWPQQ